MIRSFGARGLTMLIGLVCGLTTTHLVIERTGVENYALFSLLVALPALIPLADFGSGAALVNRIAESASPQSDGLVRTTALSIVRILCAVGTVVLILNVVLYLTGGWRWVLGATAEQDLAETAAFICVTVFAVGMPGAIAQRFLLGFEKNHLMVLLHGLQAPLTLCFVWLYSSYFVQWPRAFVAISAFAAAFLIACAGMLVALRLSKPVLSWSLARVLDVKKVRGAKVMDLGVPMVIVSVVVPFGIQLDRVLLGQLGTSDMLASYGIAAQMFVALQSLFSTAGLALWPQFIKERAQGGQPRPFLFSGMFALAAGLASLVMVYLAPTIASLVSGGRIALPLGTVFAFSLALIVQSALYPLGMFMMNKEGLRFQVIPTVLMVCANIALTVWLIPIFGAAGPVLATGLSVCTLQLIPYMIYVCRKRDGGER